MGIGLAPLYLWFGPPWFALWAAVVGGATAFVAFFSRRKDAFVLTSFAVSGTFLAMPVVEYHHLTSLVLPFICLISSPDGRSGGIMRGIAFLLVIVPFASGGHACPPVYLPYVIFAMVFS